MLRRPMSPEVRLRQKIRSQLWKLANPEKQRRYSRESQRRRRGAIHYRKLLISVLTPKE